MRSTGLGHEVVAIDVGERFVPELLERGAGGGVRRAARARRRGRHRPGPAGGAVGSPTPARRPGGLHAGHRQAAGEAADAGGRDPHARRSTRCGRSRSRSWARRRRWSASTQDIGLPLVVKPARGGSALGVKFARDAEELPKAMVGAFSYDRTVLLERYVRGRDLAVSVLEGSGGAGAAGAAGRGGGAPRGGVLRLRVTLRDRDDHLRVPGGAPRGDDRARAGAGACGCTSCSAATGWRGSI